MPRLPKTPAAWLMTLSGSLLLLFAVAMHWGMYLVVLGFKHVPPGGGEFAVALFAGITRCPSIGNPTGNCYHPSGMAISCVALLLSWLGVAVRWP